MDDKTLNKLGYITPEQIHDKEAWHNNFQTDGQYYVIYLMTDNDYDFERVTAEQINDMFRIHNIKHEDNPFWLDESKLIRNPDWQTPKHILNCLVFSCDSVDHVEEGIIYTEGEIPRTKIYRRGA